MGITKSLGKLSAVGDHDGRAGLPARGSYALDGLYDVHALGHLRHIDERRQRSGAGDVGRNISD